MKKVAILQSNYIPWKGYFDIINQVDLFVFHDDLQYTKNDWRNRNKIKTPNGSQWLTIPCGTSEKRLICDVQLTDKKWQIDHWRKIKECYSKSLYFDIYKKAFEEIYLHKVWDNLSDFNQYVIKFISKELLHIDTEFDDSRKYNLTSSKADRVKELLLKVNASDYLSGPAGENYLSKEFLLRDNIKLEIIKYDGYVEYNQLFPPFEHAVSIIDLIFNVGPDCYKYISHSSSNK